MAAQSLERADFYVYVLFDEFAEPFYVGMGHGRRWLNHESEASKGKRTTKAAIIRRMLRAGWAWIPKVLVHEGLTAERAFSYEVALIAAIGRRPDGPLVNLTDGGEGGVNPSPEARAKMSPYSLSTEAQAQRNANVSAARTGKPLSPEHRAALRVPRSPRTAEHRAKIGDIHRGKTVSEETRARLRAAGLGKKLSPKTIAKRTASLKANRQPKGQLDIWINSPGAPFDIA